MTVAALEIHGLGKSFAPPAKAGKNKSQAHD
jgi:hypothetical protein